MPTTDLTPLDRLAANDPVAQEELDQLRANVAKLDRSTKALLNELARIAKLLADCVVVMEGMSLGECHARAKLVKLEMGVGNG